jgi:hypothetical protein
VLDISSLTISGRRGGKSEAASRNTQTKTQSQQSAETEKKMITEMRIVRETYVNVDKNAIIGENDMPQEDTIITGLKDLYKYGIKNFGRCVSKIYIDKKDKQLHIGYTFRKKMQYEDTKEFYTQETWLSLEHYKETRTKEYFEVK